MMRQGADGASADDLAQEAMVRVWRKAHHYDPRKAAVTTWIFRVARNLQIDRLKFSGVFSRMLQPLVGI